MNSSIAPESKYKSVLLVCQNKDWVHSTICKINETKSNLSCGISLGTDKYHLLELIKSSEFDLVVLDIHLSKNEEFEGLWLAKKLAVEKPNLHIIIKSSIGLNSADEIFSVMIGSSVRIIGFETENLINAIFKQ